MTSKPAPLLPTEVALDAAEAGVEGLAGLLVGFGVGEQQADDGDD